MKKITDTNTLIDIFSNFQKFEQFINDPEFTNFIFSEKEITFATYAAYRYFDIDSQLAFDITFNKSQTKKFYHQAENKFVKRYDEVGREDHYIDEAEHRLILEVIWDTALYDLKNHFENKPKEAPLEDLLKDFL